MDLILNLSAVVIVANTGIVSIGFAKVSVVNVSTLELMNTFGRTLVAVSVTIGSYILYQSMKLRGNYKFTFTPVKAVAEKVSSSAQKYVLNPGNCYLIKRNPLQGGSDPGNSAMELFADLVTHGTLGFIITRHYPQKLRDRYGLMKTPMIWLSRDQSGSGVISPVDLAEISHIVKEFISSSKDAAVLIDGFEYLIMHNSFNEALELIQSLNDVAVQSGSRIIVTVDPLAVTEQQLHLLLTELMEFKTNT
jgi:hypothetical protein